MRIAVVGTGVAGLLTSHLLCDEHEVVAYEATARLGGHTHSMSLAQGGKDYVVDTGFCVFNHACYPQFVAMLDRIGLKSQPAPGGITVRNDRTRREFSTRPGGWFAQRGNLLRPYVYALRLDTARFRKTAEDFLRGRDLGTTMREFTDAGRYSAPFAEGFLPALMEAAWTADLTDPWGMPARHFLEFFRRHGLLDGRQGPEWRVIRGGSFRYIGKLIAPFQKNLRLNTPVEWIRRQTDHVELKAQGQPAERFDHVVLATGADAALSILTDPSEGEHELLGSFPYQETDAVTHTDISLLAQRRKIWAGWNVLIPPDSRACPIITHNLSALQGLDSPDPFLQTYRGAHLIAPEKILAQQQYRHPVLTWKALSVQRRWGEINGVNRTHFCGAYWGGGQHEDAVKSALAVCQYFHKKL